MRLLGAIVVGALAAWPLLAGAETPGLEAFAGAWQGRAADVAGAALAAPEAAVPLDLALTIEADGFRLRWTGLARGTDGRLAFAPLEAAFAAAGRDGVFEYRAEGASLLERMFAAPATGNPLSGETLLWARLEGDRLVVYSLAIASDGRFDLDRYAWQRTGSDLAVRYSLRTGVAEPLVVEAALAPADG
jgi:hypothetical protein